jgi:hypothetical protein
MVITGPGNPRRVVQAGICLSVAAASRGMRIAPMPAGSGVAVIADAPDGERRDGEPQVVIQRKPPWLASRWPGVLPQ